MRVRPRHHVTHENVTVSRVHHDGSQARISSLEGPAGRDFVLVAGIGVASDYYVRLALDLNQVGTVHAIDLPGFGGVPHGPHSRGIEGFADLVEAAIDELGLVDPVLVGHSMGSQVVTEVAARRDDLSTIVLIGPVVNSAESSIPRQALRLLQCAGREPFAITVHVLISYVLCGPRWFLQVLPKMMHYPIEERLPHVSAHTLILRGQHDATSPRDWARHLCDITPHARAWEIPGAAHSVMYAHAGEVAALTVEHLQHPEAEHDDPREQHISQSTNPDPEHSIARLIERLRGGLTTLRGMASGNDALVAEGNHRQLQGYDGPHDDPEVNAIPLDAAEAEEDELTSDAARRTS